LSQERFQFAAPVGPGLCVEHLLRGRHIGHIHQTIVLPAKADAGRRQRAAQPLPPVDADLDGEGEPRLNSEVTQSPAGMLKVKIPVQALAQRRHQIDLPFRRIPADVEGPTGLDAAEGTDQPLFDPFAPQQLLHQGFLRQGRTGQILDLPAGSCYDAFHRGLQVLRQSQGEPFELLEQDPPLIQPREQSRHRGEHPHVLPHVELELSGGGV
jgi:hypothetical protein